MPADTAPADTAPADTTPADTTPADTAPADTTPADTTPADTAPADTAPADTASADTTPADTAPADTAPADTAPADTAPAATLPAHGAGQISSQPSLYPADGSNAEILAIGDEALGQAPKLVSEVDTATHRRPLSPPSPYMPSSLSAWLHLGWLQQSAAAEGAAENSMAGLARPLLPTGPASPLPAGCPPIGSCTSASSSAPGLRLLVGGVLLLTPLLFLAAPRAIIPSPVPSKSLALVSLIKEPG